VNDKAQKRAKKNYRSRLSAWGFVRFELQALETDRKLIRTLARKSIEEGPKTGSPAQCAASTPGQGPKSWRHP
jgi:hypothetical protein